MNGPAMLLKSMGVDPDDIKKKVEAFQTELVQTVQYFDKHLKLIEEQNAQILALLRKPEGITDGK